MTPFFHIIYFVLKNPLGEGVGFFIFDPCKPSRLIKLVSHAHDSVIFRYHCADYIVPLPFLAMGEGEAGDRLHMLLW